MRAFANPVPREGQKQHGRKVATAPMPEVPAQDLQPPAREMIAAGYQMAIASGDKKAIFDYAKDDYEALADPIVVRQLVEWRLEATPAAEKKFYRVMRAYWSRQGKRAGEHTLEMIARDQAIYRAYVCRHPSQSRDRFIEQEGEKHLLGPDSILEVVKIYGKHRKLWLAGNILWPVVPPTAEY
jgi:hypothetical protein